VVTPGSWLPHPQAAVDLIQRRRAVSGLVRGREVKDEGTNSRVSSGEGRANQAVRDRPVLGRQAMWTAGIPCSGLADGLKCT
jgi:hypothetical protein